MENVCIVSCLNTKRDVSSVAVRNIRKSWSTIPEAMGFRLDTATDAISVTCILMSIFYLGPLITKLIFHYNCSRYDVTARGMAKNINHRAPFIIGSIYEHNMAHFKMYPTIIIVRNLVFAPISEEIAYRSLLIPILDMMYVNFSDSPWGDDRNSAYLFVAACCPLLFSVAHIHHLREHVLSGVPLPSAISAVAIQVVYTGIFAFIAAILFMRTGNILSAITSHVICNFVGLPDFSFMEPANTTRATPLSCLYKWRYVLLFFHGAGLAMFGVLLIPFTNNFNTVYWH